MLEGDEFEKWIKASHAMFETFEGRFDAYPLTVRWIEEWFESKSFVVEQKHRDRISALLNNFDYEVFGVTGQLKQKIDGQFKSLIENCLQNGRCSNVGFAVSPFLFTWNFRRFKDYSKGKREFDLVRYFAILGELLEERKESFEGIRSLRLTESEINKAVISDIFSKANECLGKVGIGHNEPVGSTKLLHVFGPYYFPLLDTKIAKTTRLISGFRENTWTLDARNTGKPVEDYYIEWMESLKAWLPRYSEAIARLEKELGSSILKLVDEGLYVMSSINLKLRVERLGLRVK